MSGGPDSAPDPASDAASAPAADEFDRQRRRVLWSLPTGLYLIGSRFEDRVNLMTANLVVQVCLEPKLVGVAVESESVTAGLIGRSGAFVISLLARTEKAVVRRFVKPVTELERDAVGEVTTMTGQAVQMVGAGRLPMTVPALASAAGYVACAVTQSQDLGSHTFFIGEVVEVGGEPGEVLRMEDTRMHYGG